MCNVHPCHPSVTHAGRGRRVRSLKHAAAHPNGRASKERPGPPLARSGDPQHQSSVRRCRHTQAIGPVPGGLFKRSCIPQEHPPPQSPPGESPKGPIGSGHPERPVQKRLDNASTLDLSARAVPSGRRGRSRPMPGADAQPRTDQNRPRPLQTAAPLQPLGCATTLKIHVRQPNAALH
jgi:hypothetical protein